MLERLLWAVCDYEALALHARCWPRVSRYLPPLTRIVRAARTRPLPLFVVSVVGVVSLLLALGWHLLIEGWETPNEDH